MNSRAFLRYSLCAILAASVGFLAGQRWFPPNAGVAASKSASRPILPAIGGALVKDAAGKQSVGSTKWEGDAASLSLDQEPITARLQRAVDIGEPFTVALLVQLVGKMTAEEAPEVFNFLKAHKEASSGPNNNGPPVWIAFWISWGGIAPEAALAQIAAGVPPYPLNDRALSHVFGGLAMRDLEKAKALALSQPDGGSRAWATESTTYRWAERDPKAAAEWAMTLEEPYRSRALSSVPWAIDQRQGPAQALQWWKSMEPGGPGTASTFGSLVSVFTGRSSKVTAEDRVALLTEASVRNFRSQTLEVAVAAEYATMDPLKGIAVLGALPPIPGRESYRALSTLVTGWAQKDPEAAGTWLVQQRNQAWGDAAVRGYINAIRATDPEAAAKWQESLQPTTSP
jgi:hypothetical protein